MLFLFLSLWGPRSAFPLGAQGRINRHLAPTIIELRIKVNTPPTHTLVSAICGRRAVQSTGQITSLWPWASSAALNRSPPCPGGPDDWLGFWSFKVGLVPVTA